MIELLENESKKHAYCAKEYNVSFDKPQKSYLNYFLFTILHLVIETIVFACFLPSKIFYI